MVKPPQFLSIFNSLLTLVSVLLLTLATSASGSPRLLRSADVHPEDYPTVQAVLSMHQSLMEQTKGRLGIQIFHSSQLGDEQMLMGQVQSGGLDMNRVSTQALGSLSPAVRLLGMPFLFRDEEHQRKVLDGPIGKEILDSLKSHGLIGLAFYDSGVRSVYSRNKAITKLADMKGLVIRIQPSEDSQSLFLSFGAKPVPLPFAQTGRAFSNQLIDAAENNIPAYASTGHYKLAPYYSLTRHSMPPEVLVISRRSWDTLSQDDQKKLINAAHDSVKIMHNMWQQREERVEASMKLAGVRFTPLPADELERFRAATDHLYKKIYSAPGIKDLADRIRAVR